MKEECVYCENEEQWEFVKNKLTGCCFQSDKYKSNFNECIFYKSNKGAGRWLI